jgi:hypothetical protein
MAAAFRFSPRASLTSAQYDLLATVDPEQVATEAEAGDLGKMESLLGLVAHTEFPVPGSFNERRAALRRTSTATAHPHTQHHLALPHASVDSTCTPDRLSGVGTRLSVEAPKALSLAQLSVQHLSWTNQEDMSSNGAMEQVRRNEQQRRGRTPEPTDGHVQV